ncbi:hypothetical protein [Laceyella putida]|uniref:Uncharacterized protein n=1 Tax=Laceyella putida TaxID=110101 RepID=A0ABW2RQP3_9BACL
MRAWLKKNRKYVMLSLVVAFALLVGVPVGLKWLINGLWNGFWPHQKTSPEVDAAFVNTIIGFITIGLTIGVTIWFNLRTQQLMAKQLEIQQQQARSTLRDLVFKERLGFYILLLSKLTRIVGLTNSYCFGVADTKDFKKSPSQTLEEIKEELIEISDLINNRAAISSQKLYEKLIDYSVECVHISLLIEIDDPECGYILEDEVQKLLSETMIPIKEIQSELRLYHIDQDIEDLGYERK